MQTEKQNLVYRFIEEIWNQQHFEALAAFMHPQFIDHSLPTTLPSDQEGLEKWITALSASFEHKTIIEDMVSDDEKIAVRISLTLKHTGMWRDIPPTGASVTAKGFRLFKINDGQIAAHWALIDGQAIESQLKKRHMVAQCGAKSK